MALPGTWQPASIPALVAARNVPSLPQSQRHAFFAAIGERLLPLSSPPDDDSDRRRERRRRDAGGHAAAMPSRHAAAIADATGDWPDEACLSFCAAMDKEKDPRCLLQCLKIVRALLSQGGGGRRTGSVWFVGLRTRCNRILLLFFPKPNPCAHDGSHGRFRPPTHHHRFHPCFLSFVSGLCAQCFNAPRATFPSRFPRRRTIPMGLRAACWSAPFAACLRAPSTWRPS